MRTLISTLLILALVVLFPVSASFARGGHAGHGGAGSDEITDPRGVDDRRGRGGEVVVYDNSDDDDSDEDDLHDENDFDEEDNLNW